MKGVRRTMTATACPLDHMQKVGGGDVGAAEVEAETVVVGVEEGGEVLIDQTTTMGGATEKTPYLGLTTIEVVMLIN